MIIKCPRCKTKLDVENEGELIQCGVCQLEFVAAAPPPRRTFLSYLGKFLQLPWLKIVRLCLVLFSLLLCFGFLIACIFAYRKNPEFFSEIDPGRIVIGVIGLGFFFLLIVNIVLWIFLPLVVVSAANRISEVLLEVRRIADKLSGPKN